MIQHQAITFLYQFLAEAIIVFILILPFTFNYYETSHYFGYTLVIFLIGFFFFLLETLKLSNNSMLLGIPITIGLFYLFQFPLGLVIIFPIIFVWRYARIRLYKQSDQSGLYLHVLDERYEHNRENLYLHVTIILSIIVILYAKEFYVLYLTFLQLFIIFLGFLLSHLAVMGKEDRKQTRFPVFIAVPIILMVISGFFLQYSKQLHVLFNNMWNGMITTFAFIAGIAAQVISIFIPSIKQYELSEEEAENWADNMEKAVESQKRFIYAEPKDHTIIIIVLASLIIGIIILFIFRAFNKQRVQPTSHVDKSVTHYEIKEDKQEKSGLFERLMRRYVRKSGNPVRDLVYEFEELANRRGHGRHSYESIEEWFSRLNVDVDVATYQKVRYGEKEVSTPEINLLKEQLEIVQQLIDKEKN